MYNYCTLFDSNYLTRGLSMYESLVKQSAEFHLYIFAFDNKSFALLGKLNLKFVTIISLREFEDEQLLSVKNSRTAGEYCWTCTPSVIKYSIETYYLESCTYLDADLYFFDDPSILIDEMRGASVLITEHRYTPKYDQSLTSGIYCVQFMTFKNNDKGLEVLNWWRDSCIEWCYARFEDGKFGDQKYLDDWTTRFDGVHVLQNLGGGVAPWNIQQYNLANKDFNLIFYHFHNFKFIGNDMVDLGSYKITKLDIAVLYSPYLQHLIGVTDRLKIYNFKDDYNNVGKHTTFRLKSFLQVLVRVVKGNYNVFHKNTLLPPHDSLDVKMFK